MRTREILEFSYKVDEKKTSLSNIYSELTNKFGELVLATSLAREFNENLDLNRVIKDILYDTYVSNKDEDMFALKCKVVNSKLTELINAYGLNKIDKDTLTKYAIKAIRQTDKDNQDKYKNIFTLYLNSYKLKLKNNPLWEDRNSKIIRKDIEKISDHITSTMYLVDLLKTNSNLNDAFNVLLLNNLDKVINLSDLFEVLGKNTDISKLYKDNKDILEIEHLEEDIEASIYKKNEVITTNANYYSKARYEYSNELCKRVANFVVNPILRTNVELTDIEHKLLYSQLSSLIKGLDEKYYAQIIYVTCLMKDNKPTLSFTVVCNGKDAKLKQRLISFAKVLKKHKDINTNVEFKLIENPKYIKDYFDMKTINVSTIISDKKAFVTNLYNSDEVNRDLPLVNFIPPIDKELVLKKER